MKSLLYTKKSENYFFPQRENSWCIVKKYISEADAKSNELFNSSTRSSTMASRIKSAAFMSGKSKNSEKKIITTIITKLINGDPLEHTVPGKDICSQDFKVLMAGIAKKNANAKLTTGRFQLALI